MSNLVKRYGLYLPKDKKSNVLSPLTSSAHSVFNQPDDPNNSTTETESVKTSTKFGQRTNLLDAKVRQQTQLAIDKAISEDATVFQYDEVFDQMHNNKQELVKQKKEVNKKPKYIAGLMQTAKQRRMEHERRRERKVQQEREDEGDLFEGKESFVTSAYRAKMNEMDQHEEKETKQNKLDALLDVTKQDNINSFYRHLYSQQQQQQQEGAQPYSSSSSSSQSDLPRLKVKQEPKETSLEDPHPTSADDKSHSSAAADVKSELTEPEETRTNTRLPPSDLFRKSRHDRSSYSTSGSRTHRSRDKKMDSEEVKHRRDDDEKHSRLDTTDSTRNERLVGDKNLPLDTPRISDKGARDLNTSTSQNESNLPKGSSESLTVSHDKTRNSSMFTKKTSGGEMCDARERYLKRKCMIQAAVVEDSSSEDDGQ